MHHRTFALQVLASIGLITLGGIFLPGLVKAQESPTDGKANIRALGVAMLNYAEDADGLLPLAMTPLVDGGFGWNRSIYVPAHWRPGQDEEWRVRQQSTFPNSVMPYCADNSVLTELALPTMDMDGVDYSQKDADPLPVGFTMNGLLHSYGGSEVEDPSYVPMLWQGLGLTNVRGMTRANPSLQCMLPGPCKYAPDGPQQMPGSGGMMFLYAKREVPPGSKFLFLSVNLTLDERALNTGAVGEQVDRKTGDPYASYTADNTPLTFWTCAGGKDDLGMAMYPCLFRPDGRDPNREE